jgi:hypothetical protein
MWELEPTADYQSNDLTVENYAVEKLNLPMNHGLNALKGQELEMMKKILYELQNVTHLHR